MRALLASLLLLASTGCDLGGERFTTLASGTRAFCAITKAGEAYGSHGQCSGEVACAGHNRDLFPTVAVSDAVGVGLSTRHGCALLAGGNVTCWGRGDDAYGAQKPPNSAFVTLSVGSPMSCGLGKNGKVECWGWYPEAMSKRDYLPVPRLEQLPIPASPQAEVCSGGSFGCAIDPKGSINCWGNDSYGQATPPRGSGHRGITCGAEHACAIKPDGRAICWGKNHYDQASPPISSTFTVLSAGGEHTCGLGEGGAVTCWGVDLGPGRPTPPPAGEFVQLAAGYNHTCGLLKSGKIECWGRLTQLFD